MKTKIVVLLLVLLALAPAATRAQTTPGDNGNEIVPMINWEGVDVAQALDIYAKYVGRTLLRASLPNVQIILKTSTPLTKNETIEALQAVFALNGISVINVGDKFVKVVPVAEANSVGAPFSNDTAEQLPALGSYVTRIVQLQFVKPSEMIPILQPFAKLANSILAIDSNGILVLRDNAENVKRMMEMIAKIDVNVPEEFISEVIPIKYAKAADIASALSGLGGSGSVVAGIGGGGSTAPISGFSPSRNTSGIQSGGALTGGGTGGTGFGGRTTSSYGNTTPNGTPSTGSSFQSRLQSIINRASTGGGQQDQIQIFGQAKIIPDERANSLLVFATRADMIKIKDVISKLDVMLPQVLIEAVILDVSLGHQFTFGVSAAQNPKNFGSGVIGGGGFNNGQTFLGTMQNLVTNFSGTNITSIVSSVTSSYGTNGSSFGNSLGNGFSYFANIGPSWDIALQALQADSTATVIQRPRLTASQAQPATFFVGESLPYITSTYNNGAYGNQSSYSQLNVGVELDVTPFINPDGLVVMDINQEIDDVSGFTSIDGNQVPNTTKRTLQSEINVRNRDTIILGGFIKSSKSDSVSGVPWLSDIPILGNLFKQKNDQKNREELLVMMRPTVLKTPEIAAAQTLVEERRLPGVSAAASDDAAYERELIEKQRKAEQKRALKYGYSDGFYGTHTNADDDNYPYSLPSIDGSSTNSISVNTNAAAMKPVPAFVPLLITNQPTTNSEDHARAAMEDKMNELDSIGNVTK